MEGEPRIMDEHEHNGELVMNVPDSDRVISDRVESESVVVVDATDLLNNVANSQRKRKECKHSECSKQAVVKDYCQVHARGNVDNEVLDKYVEKKKISQKKLCKFDGCTKHVITNVMRRQLTGMIEFITYHQIRFANLALERRNAR